jgi:hypothetical protein
MYCVVKCIVRGNQACVKNADLRHPSCTFVMYRRKSASPVHNVLIIGMKQEVKCWFVDIILRNERSELNKNCQF